MKFLFLSLLLFSFSVEYIQAKSTIVEKDSITVIRGNIISPNGDPIEDVVIHCPSPEQTEVSDAKGTFSIKALIGSKITLQRLGYVAREVTIDNLFMRIVMAEDVQLLEAVTVFSSKNINDIDLRKMTGSITTIDMKQLSGRPEMDMLKLLQGQVPGLMVITDGELGKRPVVRIRGEASFENKQTSVNEPLYVLDGVIITSDAFLALNPEDIDEVKVLKDASATALYGIKAANGVIEMTSKRGIAGKTLISAGVNYGVTLRGPRGVDLMNSEEKLELERLIGNPAAPGYRYSEEYIRKQQYNAPNLDQLILEGQQKIDSLKQINTDWFKKLIRVNRYQSYSVGIRGGREGATFYYSANYSKQGGRVEGNDIDRFALRSNLDYTLFPNMDLSINIGAGVSQTNTENGSNYSPSDLVYNLNPYEQKTKEVELFSYGDRTFYDLMNQYRSKSSSKRLESSFIYHWQIVDNLHLSAVAGIDYVLNESKTIIPSSSYLEKIIPLNAKGKLEQEKGTISNISSNVRLNYDKTWGNHSLSASINTDYYKSQRDNVGAIGRGLAPGTTTPSGVNQTLTENSYRASIYGGKYTDAQLGIGAAAGYTYKNIYEFYGSYKRDASSLLPSNKRWNAAWSAGLGWKVGEYGFFKKQNLVTDMKIRLSYGNTAGMAGISMSSTMPIYKYTDDIYGDGRVFILSDLYNTELVPQQSGTLNGGMEFTLFKKINIYFDLYKTRIKDALLNIPIAPSNGFITMARNIGVLQNKGYEIRISGSPITTDRFQWNSSISLSWNKNEVIKLYDGDELYLSEEVFPDYEVGQPIGVIYGLKALGINSLDGYPRFLSATGEEITYQSDIKREDFSNLGYSTPPYMGFFNNTFTYGSLSFSFDLYFSFGGIAQYSRTYVRDYSGVVYNAVKGQTKDMWFKKGDENKIYPAYNMNSSVAEILIHPSTNTVYKTDFIRLNNARIGYLMPHRLVNKMGSKISYLRLFLQGQNLLTINRERDKASLANITQPVISLGLNISL